MPRIPVNVFLYIEFEFLLTYHLLLFFVAGRARNKENILKIGDLFGKYHISYYHFLKNEDEWGYDMKILIHYIIYLRIHLLIYLIRKLFIIV